jgi:hypothetical protein
VTCRSRPPSLAGRPLPRSLTVKCVSSLLPSRPGAVSQSPASKTVCARSHARAQDRRCRSHPGADLGGLGGACSCSSSFPLYPWRSTDRVDRRSPLATLPLARSPWIRKAARKSATLHAKSASLSDGLRVSAEPKFNSKARTGLWPPSSFEPAVAAFVSSFSPFPLPRLFVVCRSPSLP